MAKRWPEILNEPDGSPTKIYHLDWVGVFPGLEKGYYREDFKSILITKSTPFFCAI